MVKDVMTVREFLDQVLSGEITDRTGFGYWGKIYKGKREKTKIKAIPSEMMDGRYPPPWATLVFWYEKE